MASAIDGKRSTVRPKSRVAGTTIAWLDKSKGGPPLLLETPPERKFARRSFEFF
ncbi:MAG: hypothetical protein OXF02_04910 [Simkaniaceae bacterium]|nr:hypothetical protein [Simkaniaceae bacterium]